MNKKKWGYHAVICTAVGLILLGGSIARDAEETVAVREEWAEGAERQVERAEVSAELAEPSAEGGEVPVKLAEPPAKTLVKEQVIHTKQTEASDTICLPTGQVMRGFGWVEEDGAWRYHSGIDIVLTQGKAVRIAQGGTVHRVERSVVGYTVEVKSGDDLWRYEPLASVNAIVGKQVEAGIVIGTIEDGIALHIGRQRGGTWTDPIGK